MRINPSGYRFFAVLFLFAQLVLQSEVLADSTALTGHVPSEQILKSREIGRKSPSDKMELAITLKLKDPEKLTEFLRRLTDPSDSLYRQYLTTAQFNERFSPSQAELDQVVQYLTDLGLKVVEVHPNRLVIDVEGPVSVVERAFKTELHRYLSVDGRVVHAPISEPLIPSDIAGKLSSVVGLNNFALMKTHLDQSAEPVPYKSISEYLTPSNIKTAYNLNSITTGSAGEVLGLIEMAGYKPSDLSAYASLYSLQVPPIDTVLVDKAKNTIAAASIETITDLELVTAAASGLTKIIIYMTPNSSKGMIDTYSKIASDNLVNELSSSLGDTEEKISPSDLRAEGVIFQQMASEGLSVFAASGDSGAFDNPEKPTLPRVDDPASQPFVTGVGGTTMARALGGGYLPESSWGNPASTAKDKTESASGGGGGISTIWPLPSWQSGLATTANLGSSTKRMVPDVSLEGNEETGYPIYSNGKLTVVGGTSCGAPLWASFISMVNHQRVANGLPRLGYLNPILYSIGKSSSYATSFHDVSDGTTNLHYPAVTGYDLSTGWGSFNGQELFTLLVNKTVSP